MKTRFYFCFYSFFSPSGITNCLLLFPCTQLPVPLGHAEERRREEGEGGEEEEENQGGRYKKDSLTNINMACVCVVCVCVSRCVLYYCICEACAVCEMCSYEGMSGRGGGARGRRGGAVGWGLLTIQLALKAHYPHLQYFHIANPRLITVNSKTKLARPLGCEPKSVFFFYFCFFNF